MTTQGNGAEAAQKPADPINDAYRMLTMLEVNVVALDPNLSLASIAISMKRIANALEGHPRANGSLMDIANAVRGLQTKGY